VTPYVRARALVAAMLRDIALWMPREDVFIDAAVYLWEPRAAGCFRAEIDLFSTFTPASARDRFVFAEGLARAIPFLFDSKVSQESTLANPELPASAADFLRSRRESGQYHGCHAVLLSSQATLDRWSEMPDPGLAAGSMQRDTLFVATCDTARSTVGATDAARLSDAILVGRGGRLEPVSEQRLRLRFLNTLIGKAAGKSLTADLESEGVLR